MEFGGERIKCVISPNSSLFDLLERKNTAGNVSLTFVTHNTQQMATKEWKRRTEERQKSDKIASANKVFDR